VRALGIELVTEGIEGFLLLEGVEAGRAGNLLDRAVHALGLAVGLGVLRIIAPFS
jgi:hypothetical protein